MSGSVERGLEMSFDETINVYFVTTGLKTDPTSEECVKTALTLLSTHIKEDSIRKITASDGFPLIASGRLTKKDVFVFDRFEGDFFEQLQLTKSLILGPRCLVVCLRNKEPIPLGTSPVFTTAMRNLQISATGITVQMKERLRILIQWMGGHYFQNFGRSVTHLISNTIKSTKYEYATTNGIPVMHVDWVQRVWDRSCVEDVRAAGPEFDKYRLPIFFGTNITCSGLDASKRNEVMRLVNQNGGTYHSAFRSQVIDILITEKDKTNSDKYKAAVTYKKDILLANWIFHSVEKGFALPTKGYLVKLIKVSTPTKADQSIADFTQMSNISRISVASTKKGCNLMSTLNDTVGSAMNETHNAHGTFVNPGPIVGPSSVKDLKRILLTKTCQVMHYNLVYDEISPEQAKKAGNFLDGCCIYLSGFKLDEREKLNRILNLGGATRYDVINERITHIIVGQWDAAEFQTWNKDGLLAAGVHIVRLNWLLESITLKQLANENNYRMSCPIAREPDTPSPSSKRTLRSMNSSFKQPPKFDKNIKKKLFDSNTDKEVTVRSTTAEDDEHHLIAQYSQENVATAAMPPPPIAIRTRSKTATINEASCREEGNETTLTSGKPIASSTQLLSVEPPPSSEMSSVDYDNLDFLNGMSIYVDSINYSDELYRQMVNECEAAMGNLVPAKYKDPVDYAIVSFECPFDPATLPVRARHIVTELYIEMCLKANKLVPIEYYHRHIPSGANAKPLAEMTIVVSMYAGLERDFIDSMAVCLGAHNNSTFVKKERPLLVCPTSSGSKYEAALKWGYPVVRSDWLVQCAETGEKLSYMSFLVGSCAQDFPPLPSAITLPRDPVTTRTRAENDHLMQPPDTPKASGANNATLEFTPLRNKRVSELAGGPPVHEGQCTPATQSAANAPVSFQSPHTPSSSANNRDFDYLESLLAGIEDDAERECICEVILEMRQNPTPELERIRRQACTPIKIPTPKGIGYPDFCKTPEFKRRMADAFERRLRLPTKKLKPDTPIDDIRRRILHATCKSLGIPCSYDEKQQQQTSVASPKSLRSSKASTSIAPTATPPTTSRNLCGAIAPRLLFGNVDEAHSPNRASTTCIPDTQTLERDMNVENNNDESAATAFICGGLGERASLGKSTTINFDKISFEESTTINTSTINANAAIQAGVAASAAASSPEIQKITEYLRNVESRRESLNRNKEVEEESVVNAAKEKLDENGQGVKPFETEQFDLGLEEVGWRDPTQWSQEQRASKLKIAAPLMQHVGRPLFSLSCPTIEDLNGIIKIIKDLGGEVCENLTKFDPESTHFICERPNRAEKIMGSIASGKWVLSLKYLEECHVRGVFVDEERFEWGNGKALNLPSLTPDELIIAKAAHSWRKRLSAGASNKADGAFIGFRVLLHLSDRHQESMNNVIRAGMGTTINAVPPYSKSTGASQATHCFIDVKKAPLAKADYEFLKKNGVRILSHMFINSYLMTGNDLTQFDIKM